MKKLRFSTRAVSALLALCIVFMLAVSSVVTSYSAEDDEIVYNGNDYANYNKTQEEISKQYDVAYGAGETYVDGDPSTYYEEEPSFVYPYSGGKLTEDTHEAMTALANYMRWIAGVDPLKEPSVHSEDLQVGAMIRKWDGNHTVNYFNKPEDMSDELWAQGANVKHNILAFYYPPRLAIDGWINEGYSSYSGYFTTIGHRMAIIDYRLSSLQFGYAGSIAIGNKAALNNTVPDQAFFAFPAPGNMPMNIIDGGVAAWSVQLNNSFLSYSASSGTTVTVTNITTGESYECTTANKKLQYDSAERTLFFVQPKPTYKGYLYADGSDYKVEITGLTDVATKKAAKIEYTVNFFDVTNHMETKVKYVGLTEHGFMEVIVDEESATSENLKKIAAALTNNILITCENGRELFIPTMGDWIIDEKNKCFRNSVDRENVPDLILDPNGQLDDIKIPYYAHSNLSTLSADPPNPTAGDSGTLKVYSRYTSTRSGIEIFQITKRGNSYTATKRYNNQDAYDRPADEFESIDNNTHVYMVKSYKESDSGEYLALHYSPNEIFPRQVYMTNIVAVNVSAGPEPEPDLENLGDLNGDGKINVKDATVLQKHIVGISYISDQYRNRADINLDSKLDGNDVTKLLKVIIHLDAI